ncbi:tRNA 2-thiocytidine biosynthesis protein TtcA [Candidatus Woesearchaeota archaeon]|nr:tRNA 2-thiocytidine biosynthesis protein TtcA [Candidatus Woesearchaeota archaeon]
MKCEKCNEKAVYRNPDLCRTHLFKYVEGTVRQTIRQYNLFDKKDKICVAVSGGKDSTMLIYLLKKFGYDVEGLAIDEGIKRYRDKSLEFLKRFCKEQGIKLKIVAYKDEYGRTLDEMVKTTKYPCAACGPLRREMLNKYSKGFDKIATGHNLDDESQAVMLNLIKNNMALLLRSGPKLDKIEGFVQRVKPLYLLPERLVRAYTFMKGLDVDFEECPHMTNSFRNRIRQVLNKYESVNPGTKMALALAGEGVNFKTHKEFKNQAFSKSITAGNDVTENV